MGFMERLRITAHLYPPAMGLHDGAHNGQAQAAGVAGLVARGVAAVEALEQVRQVLRGNRLALVVDVQG